MAPTFNEIFELKCLTELEDVGIVALAIGLIAIPACLFLPVPQYYKLYRRGNAVGFSSLMLFIGNIGRAFNVLNLVILHHDQILVCTSEPGMMSKCQPSLLVLYSGITGFISLFPLYFVVMWMNRRYLGTRGGQSSQRILMIGLISQIVVIMLVSAPLAALFKEDGRCAPLETYANVIGFFNAFCLCAQFVPQIILTWTRREGGAVSYMMYIPDVIGGYVMTIEKAFGTHERISTWLPYALMHTLELIMLVLNAAFDDSLRTMFRTSKVLQKVRLGATSLMKSMEGLEDPPLEQIDQRERTSRASYLAASILIAHHLYPQMSSRSRPQTEGRSCPLGSNDSHLVRFPPHDLKLLFQRAPISGSSIHLAPSFGRKVRER